jgi:hypothetical protein
VAEVGDDSPVPRVDTGVLEWPSHVSAHLLARSSSPAGLHVALRSPAPSGYPSHGKGTNN